MPMPPMEPIEIARPIFSHSASVSPVTGSPTAIRYMAPTKRGVLDRQEEVGDPAVVLVVLQRLDHVVGRVRPVEAGPEVDDRDDDQDHDRADPEPATQTGEQPAAVADEGQARDHQADQPEVALLVPPLLRRAVGDGAVRDVGHGDLLRSTLYMTIRFVKRGGKVGPDEYANRDGATPRVGRVGAMTLPQRLLRVVPVVLLASTAYWMTDVGQRRLLQEPSASASGSPSTTWWCSCIAVIAGPLLLRLLGVPRVLLHTLVAVLATSTLWYAAGEILRVLDPDRRTTRWSPCRRPWPPDSWAG